MAIDKEDAKLIAEAVTKAIGKGGPPNTGNQKPGTGHTALDDAMKSTSDAMSPFGKNLKDGGELAKKGLEAVHKAVTDSMGGWRDLSKSGAGFNNDIIGMTVAAAGTRMPLADFAGVIKENASNFAGLGGNVTRGAEAFAKLGKEMFDSGITDSLKQLGYTNKDLNEVLALQIGTVRGSMRDDKASREAAIQSAADLANEMDLMAKMTGRTREEQQEAMKKAQGDASVEAKLRLIGIKEGPEAEKKARLEFLKQYNEAEAQGRGQMFKEVFATGQVMSKEAATQAALDGKAAEATRNAALATSKGDAESASKFNAQAREETLKLNQDETRLRQATLGKAGGVASESISATMMNKTARADFDAAQSIRGEDKFKNASEAELLAESKRRAQEAQAGKDKDGTDVSGATKAAVQLGNRLDDVQSALKTGLLEPLNKEIGPGLKTFADKYLSGKDFEGSGKRIAPAIEGAMARGNKAAQADGAPDRMTQPDEAGIATGIAKGVGFAEGKLLKGAKAALPKPIPEKALGGPVDEGKPYIVGDGGEEEIFVPKTAGEIIPKSMLAPKGLGSRSENMEGASKSMQSMDPAKMFAELKAKTATGGLNFNEISKDISTTVSGGGSSTVKVPDMADMTKKFETSFADFDKAATKNIKLDNLTSSFKTSFNDFNTDTIKNVKLDNLTSSFKTSFNDFNKDTATNIKFDDLTSSFKTSFDDFGSEISNYADLDDLMSPFEESFSSFNNDFESMIASSTEDIADAMGGSKASAAQAKIDDAIAEKQKALDKIVFMLNEVSDEDFDQSAWDDAIAERDAAQAKLDKVIEDSMSDLASGLDEFSDGWGESIDKVSADISDAIPYDEFGDLDGAIAKQQSATQIDNKEAEFNKIREEQGAEAEAKARQQAVKAGAMKEVVAGSSPTATQGRGITADSITIGPNGMPVAKPKSTAAAVPDKPAEKKASPGKAINPETGEEYTPLSELEKQAGATKAAPPKPAGGGDKAATLDDVVKSLNALNTKMGQLIDVNETGHKASAKAAKSGSANLYNK